MIYICILCSWKHRKIKIFNKLKFIIRLRNIFLAFMLVHMVYCAEWFWSKFKMDSKAFENAFEMALQKNEELYLSFSLGSKTTRPISISTHEAHVTLPPSAPQRSRPSSPSPWVADDSAPRISRIILLPFVPSSDSAKRKLSLRILCFLGFFVWKPWPDPPL